MNTDASSSFMPSVLDAADRIRQGTLTPVQLVEQSLEAIKTHNSTLNAFGDVYTESALEQARILTAEAQANQFRGPLHGIPFGIKDLFSTANLRTTRGSLTGWFDPRSTNTCTKRPAAQASSSPALNTANSYCTELLPNLPTRRPISMRSGKAIDAK